MRGSGRWRRGILEGKSFMGGSGSGGCGRLFDVLLLWLMLIPDIFLGSRIRIASYTFSHLPYGAWRVIISTIYTGYMSILCLFLPIAPGRVISLLSLPELVQSATLIPALGPLALGSKKLSLRLCSNTVLDPDLPVYTFSPHVNTT